jgi:hypothetical protein
LSSKLNISEKFRSWLAALPSNPDAERNSSGNQQGMMADLG